MYGRTGLLRQKPHRAGVALLKHRVEVAQHRGRVGKVVRGAAPHADRHDGNTRRHLGVEGREGQ